MSEQIAAPAFQDIMERFPTFVTSETRPGFEGMVVEASHLKEFARALRDDYAYDYLTSITAVDYFPEDKIEVVYHVNKTLGGPLLTFRTQCPRDNCIIPT